MARIRSIKPEFWTDEKVVSLSPLARLLFVGLWNFADDDGRMEYSPLRIKLQILPLDPTDCSGELGEIRGSLVDVYEVEGRQYLQIRNFGKHQKVDKRTASKFPAPPHGFSESPRIPPNPPDGKEGSGGEKEGKGSTGGKAYAFQGQIIRVTTQDFERLKGLYHGIPDLVAELTNIDRKFAEKPPKDWWPTLNAWLNRDHQNRIAQRPPTRADRERKTNVQTL